MLALASLLLQSETLLTFRSIHLHSCLHYYIVSLRGGSRIDTTKLGTMKLSSFTASVVTSDGTAGGTRARVRGRYDDVEDHDDVIDDDDDASCDSLDDNYTAHRKQHANHHHHQQQHHTLSNHQTIASIQPPTAEDTSPSYLLTRANKRSSRLIAKLHRLAMEKEELRNRYEDICKKERQFVLSTKLAQDATRRFNITQQENTRLKTGRICLLRTNNSLHFHPPRSSHHTSCFCD